MRQKRFELCEQAATEQDPTDYRAAGKRPAAEKYEHGIEEDDMNSSAEPNMQDSLHFNCCDVLAKNCDWRVSGDSEQEIMLLVDQHSQEKHGLKLDDETRNGVHHAIHKKAA